MKRQSSKRCLTSYLGRALLAPALAASLAATPNLVVAQEEGTAAQSEEQARERAEALLERAREELNKESFQAAREFVQRARSVDSSTPGLAEMLQQIREAEVSAEREKTREQVENLADTAEQLRKADRFDEARERIEQALRIDPQNQKALRIRERIMRDMNKAQREAVEDQVEVLLDRADGAVKAGNLDEARRLQEQAYEIGGDAFARELNELTQDINEAQTQALLREAEGQMNANRLGEARDTLNSVLTVDPGNRDARRMLEEVREKAAAAAAQQRPPAPSVPSAQQPSVQQPSVQQPSVRPPAPPRPAQPAIQQPSMQQPAVPQQAPPMTVTDGDSSAQQSQQQADARRRAEEQRRMEEQRAREQQERARAEEQRRREEDQKRLEEQERMQREQEDAAAEALRRRREEEARQAEQARQEEQQRQEELRTTARQQAERAYSEGVELYESGNLAQARQRWLDAKELDPTYTEPDSYLENTQEEFNAFLANQAEREEFERREAEALEKMNTLINFSTTAPQPLGRFLENLKVFAPIDYVVAGQVDARIEASFEDEPLHEVLDAVLTPIGLRWERSPGTDRVIITPDLRTEVFPVLPQTTNTVESLVEEGVIQRLLYGPAGEPPLQGQEILIDPRRNVIVVTDSETNLRKFRRFVEDLKGTESAQLIFSSYEIDERRAPEIKALLEALLSADDDAPYNPERKLILEGSTLIIKDTPENIQKVEATLQDQQFLSKFYDNTLDVATFNLTPVLAFDDNPDLKRAFADQVRQVVETLLYATEGRSRAEAQGRRLFYDPATMQLTIVDYPDNLESVQNYIESLPQIRSRRRSKIIFLDWATSGDLVSQIEQFLGIAGGGQTQSAGSGTSTQVSLSVEDEVEFRNAFFRLLRVNENDVVDENDDSIELYVRTGTTNQETTIEEFRSEFIDDYEVVADDISPSSTPGEGRARVTIRYVPNQGAGGGDLSGGGLDPELDPETEEVDEEETAEEEGLNIVAVENLNAIFVEYDNIEDLREVEFWVDTLDIPTLQVAIEVKFVEVVTNKAKSLKNQFSVGDLTESQTLSDSVLRSRFGQDRDEFVSPFETPLESFDSANLLKGVTVLDFIVNNGASPISVELRMLEAQGLINVVNGPTVTVLNNESADFRVERNFGIARPPEGATGGNNQDNFIQPAGITPVDMTVDPQVTRAGNITLDIDVEINDFDQNLGQALALVPEEATPLQTILAPNAITASLGTFGVLRKELTTQARIRDGGTVVLGGWRNERVDEQRSGVPILQDIPYIGPLLFGRFQRDDDRITLLIFLTGNVVRD